VKSIDPKNLQAELAEYLRQVKLEMPERRLALSKQLGQHLLVEPSLLERIASAASAFDTGLVVEVGTGPGNLTLALARAFDRVIGVEVDKGLFELASELLASEPDVMLVHGDILKLSLPELAEGARYTLVSNVPYSISGPFLAKLALEAEGLEGAVLMLQNEVASRMAARPGAAAYGSLSVLLGCYYRVEPLFKVSASAFMPKPQVSSQVLRVTPLAAPLLPWEKAPALEALLRASFGSRRKQLANSLKHHLLPTSPEALASALRAAGVSGEARAEQLSPQQFTSLVASCQESGVRLL